MKKRKLVRHFMPSCSKSMISLLLLRLGLPAAAQEQLVGATGPLFKAS